MTRRWLMLVFGATLFVAGCILPQPLPQSLSPQQEAYRQQVLKVPTEFMISNDKVGEAWGRAQVFLTKYGSMKLQTVTDYVIDTYNPPQENGFGYTLTKTPGNGVATISVNCVSRVVDYLNPERVKDAQRSADLNAHILSDYMMSGSLPFPEMIER